MNEVFVALRFPERPRGCFHWQSPAQLTGYFFQWIFQLPALSVWQLLLYFCLEVNRQQILPLISEKFSQPINKDIAIFAKPEKIANPITSLTICSYVYWESTNPLLQVVVLKTMWITDIHFSHFLRLK
jgi:hypothetical protein